MKLNDLGRFAVESASLLGNSGRTATKISVLGEEFHVDSGRQSQTHCITLSSRVDGDELKTVETSIERTLSFLDKVKEKAYAVRGGIISMHFDTNTKEYTAKAQLALLDEGDKFTHPLLKSLTAGATNKNPDKAETIALDNVLRLMGEL